MTYLKQQVRLFFDVILYDASFSTTFRRMAGVFRQVCVDLTQIMFMLPQLVLLHKSPQSYNTTQ